MSMSKGEPQLLKETNRRLVLEIIERHYSVSRASIARSSGLSATTVASIVNDLVDEGLVTVIGPGLSRRGRRPIMYRINREARYVVGVEVGGSCLTVIVTDLGLNVVSETHVDVGDLEGQELVRTLYQSIGQGIRESGVDSGKVIGIGVASPGLIHNQSGTVIQAVNLGWQDIPLKGIIEHELGLPTYVENVNNAAALGEYELALDRKVSRFLYMNIGRGVGAGLIVNGDILKGAAVSASEIGHFVVDRHGERCSCGARGCLETVVSVRAIESQASRIAAREAENGSCGLLGPNQGAITLDVLADAAQNGDTAALGVFTQAGEWLGIVVAGLINLLNPEVIMLGGRVIRAAENVLLNTVRNIARQNSLPSFFGMTTFMTPKLGDLSSSMGAVSTVIQGEFGRNFISSERSSEER